MKRGKDRIIILLLCMLFTGYIGQYCYFTHAHMDADGKIVMHSHPFGSNTDKTPFHRHTSAEFHTIDSQTGINLTPDIRTAVVFHAPEIVLDGFRKSDYLFCPAGNKKTNDNLRAPPYC